MASARMMGEAEEREHERRVFIRELREAEEGSLAERQEAAREFLEDMQQRPGMIDEAVGDLIRGVYGRGARDAARAVLQNRSMNRQAWLLVTVAAIDWHVPGDLARRAYKKLSPADQKRIKREISGAIGRVRQQAARERRLYEQGGQ